MQLARHYRYHPSCIGIYGLCAQTFVYQEFVNEWTEPVDAVYSFPLPPEARATEFLYWRNDTTFKAILKVREQATNPGTGEGGVVALVNKYIGRNGIKVQLMGIEPGAIQKVQLHYTSICDYYMGKASYNFPLDTQDFAIIKDAHLEHFPDALTVASLLFGASDSRFFRAKGIPCYGVCPMLIDKGELSRVHGIDERISVENMVRGTRVFTDIVKRLCR